MDFNFWKNEKISTSYTVSEKKNGITVLHVTADKDDSSTRMEFTVVWNIPDIGVHALWSPGSFTDKTIVPNYGQSSDSCEMSNAPIYSDVDYSDRNRQTVACSDAKNCVRIMTGVNENTAELECTVGIDAGCNCMHYEADIRIDRRDIPFYEAVEDASLWFESYDGYTPAPVPDDAKKPLYSTWYSFHKGVDVGEITSECEFFSKLGTDVMILDDGWQTANNEGGFDYCGDWMPAENKVPDMKAFVDAVHKTGTKFMLWYAVPFISEYSAVYPSFKDKMLDNFPGPAHVVDPRYPDVREYLINHYRQAVIDWNLDGFKFDFVDWFKASDKVTDEMDITSVYDAVDRLMKDVISALRELNPDILIEFRQTYIGPLMRTFGNMFRSSDCPNDSLRNRLNTLTLRMTSGNTAVHSDMMMWNYDESPEQAAFQLTNVLFAVPQISVRHKLLPKEHAEMIKAYLDFWTENRDVLMNGKMRYRGYISNYPFVSSKLDDKEVCAVYGGLIAYIEKLSDEIAVVNASYDNKVIFDVKEGSGRYSYAVYDCRGIKTAGGEISLGSDIAVLSDIPVNGVIKLKRI